MLFSLVPEDFVRVPVMYRQPGRPWHLGCQNQPFLHDAFIPMLRESQRRNTARFSCCNRRQAGDSEHKPCQVGECCKQTEDRSKVTEAEKKIATINFGGFAPEEIKVKVTDKAVVIRAERDSPFCSVKVTKTVPLPEGADKTGVVCRYVDGHVILQLPPSPNSALNGVTEKQGEEKTTEPGKKHEAQTEEKKDAIKSESCQKCPRSDRGSDGDKQREMQAVLENNMKMLSGLFSTIFGLPLEAKEEEKKESDKEAKRETDKPTSEPEEREDKDTHTESSVTNNESEDKDGEETCLMLKYDEELALKDDESNVVKVEKHEADDSLLSQQTTVTDLEGDTGDLSGEIEENLEGRSSPTDVSNTESSEPFIEIPDEAEEFKVQLDLSNYKPEQIRVVFSDGDVIVEAEREIERENYSEVEKLSRRIRVPENVEESKLKSVLDARGVMTIRAPFTTDGDQTWQLIKITHED